MPYEKRKYYQITHGTMKHKFIHHQFIGCLSSYMPECWDSSDTFICPASSCMNRSEFFPCNDKKYCIAKHLVCDGYDQCQDKSGSCMIEKK